MNDTFEKLVESFVAEYKVFAELTNKEKKIRSALSLASAAGVLRTIANLYANELKNPEKADGADKVIEKRVIPVLMKI